MLIEASPNDDDTEKPHDATSSVDQADSIQKPKEQHTCSRHSIYVLPCVDSHRGM